MQKYLSIIKLRIICFVDMLTSVFVRVPYLLWFMDSCKLRLIHCNISYNYINRTSLTYVLSRVLVRVWFLTFPLLFDDLCFCLPEYCKRNRDN